MNVLQFDIVYCFFMINSGSRNQLEKQNHKSDTVSSSPALGVTSGDTWCPSTPCTKGPQSTLMSLISCCQTHHPKTRWFKTTIHFAQYWLAFWAQEEGFPVFNWIYSPRCGQLAFTSLVLAACWLGYFGSLSSSNKLAQAHVHGGCRDLIAVRGQVPKCKVFKLLIASNLPLYLLAKANHKAKLNLRSRERING